MRHECCNASSEIRLADNHDVSLLKVTFGWSGQGASTKQSYESLVDRTLTVVSAYAVRSDALKAIQT